MRAAWLSPIVLVALLAPARAGAQDVTTTSTVATPGGPALAPVPPPTEPDAVETQTPAAPAPAPAVEAPAPAVEAPPPEVPAPPAPVVEAPPPAPVEEPSAPTPPAAAAVEKEKDPQKSQLVRNIGESGSSDDRHWFVSGSLELRMLAVSDEDPANDRLMVYAIRGGYGLLPGLSLFGSLSLNQRFVAEEGESGFLFNDLQLALNYNQTLKVPLPALGDHDLSLTHRAGFYLPTSRRSQANDIYLVPELLERARINLVDRLYFGVDLIGRYQVAQYAEGAGPGAPPLTQLLMAGSVAAEYNLLESERFGFITVGADLSSIYRLRYAARDSSEQVRWKQSYGWSLYGVYAPYPFLAFTALLYTGDDVVRADGARRIEFLDRDSSQLMFNVTARY
ncbi:MAG: hypothetical protein IPG45_33115 [Deltaproteobacteria bacterium]|jgi:hypothetical protein|nr:hypothetical protein [Deltaproteobacteria bacterium]